jgi:hypothetical protein
MAQLSYGYITKKSAQISLGGWLAIFFGQVSF